MTFKIIFAILYHLTIKNNQMKKNALVVFLFIAITASISVVLSSCSKDKTVLAPDWKEDATGKYPVSMTAVVQLPHHLVNNRHPEDKVAAFINNECRGIGVQVNIPDSVPVFYIMIHGTSSEQQKVAFKYYSARNSYLFTTSYFLDFAPDDNYGTIDKPAMLDLKMQ
jgi:hypothetical protein